MNQPKPTGALLPPFSKEYLANEHDAKTFDQPKPTSEWTAEYVRRLQFNASERQYEAIADAHNAALAAAKPKTTEYAQGWYDHVLAARSQIEDLEQQLAAERESHESSILSYITTHQADVNYNTELKQELDTLVDALKRIASGTTDYTTSEIAESALAKVGTYPLPGGRTK